MKRKKIFYFLIGIISIGNINAQIAYYTAKGIKNDCVRRDTAFSFRKDQAAKLSAYLKDFLPEQGRVDDSLDVDAILNFFIDNPFFGKEVAPLIGKASGVRSLLESSTASALGGLDVTNIANGISQFMIKRAKEELTIAFFDRFRKYAEENPEFEVLFPKTTNNLENLLSYKYPEFLPALRTGFFEDIKSVPYHLDDVLELPRYQALLKDLPEAKVAVRTVRLVYELESGNSHAANILTKFAAFPEWKQSTSSHGFTNFGSSVKLAAIFSQSLRNDTSVSHSSRAWITYPDMESLVLDDITFKLYLGLVYQMVKNDSVGFYFGDKNEQISLIGFDSLMSKQKNNLFLFRNKVTEFIELADKVDKVMDTIHLQNLRRQATVEDAFYDYIDVSLDVLDYAFSIGMLFDENLDIGEYTLIARSANDLYRNIYKQEYTQAINSLVDILQQTKKLTDENHLDIPDTTATLLKSIGVKVDLETREGVEELNKKHIANIDDYLTSPEAKPGYVPQLQKIKSQYYWNQIDAKFLKISQYGLFMANMANAQSSQEVASILDNATLPVGSSSIKKNSKTNVAIQSYLGPYIRFGDIDNTNAWTSQFGVTAPIGIAFSKGLSGKGGSVSLFLSLLDVGAIVDYQLKSETITSPGGMDTTTIHKDYKVELGQIFSPGTYLVYGFPFRLPISFGIGGQFGPGLGQIDDNNDAVVNNPEWRWNAFLAVDIPLFNIVNVSREKNK